MQKSRAMKSTRQIGDPTRSRVVGSVLRMAVVALLSLGPLSPFAGAAASDADHKAAVRQPVGLFLTWQRDPTATMTIDWHTVADESGQLAAPILQYRPSGAERWNRAEGDSRSFPFSDRVIHRVELTGLESGTDYQFRLDGYGRTYTFRTMPSDLNQPLVFATGGDVRHRQSWMERTNTVAMQYDPQFIVWGGDLAYADGREDRLHYWYEFFDAIMNTLITDDGRVIPIIVGIGNHEVLDHYYFRMDEYEQTDAGRARVAPYFYELFAFPGQPGYNALDFADYLSLIILDTDHSNPIEGAQTDWLRSTLAARINVPHVIPVYHVPAFPSHRDYNGRVQSGIREHWVPLFEQANVRIAFENHDHAYKRTHPIREGRISPNGIVYVGDGAWGVGVREGNNRDQWYIDQFASVRHAIIVTLHGPHQHLLMVSEDGDVIDEYPRTPQRRR